MKTPRRVRHQLDRNDGSAGAHDRKQIQRLLIELDRYADVLISSGYMAWDLSSEDRAIVVAMIEGRPHYATAEEVDHAVAALRTLWTRSGWDHLMVLSLELGRHPPGAARLKRLPGWKPP